jgi:two-component system response regulator GlrR
MADPKPRLLLVDDDPSLLRLLTLRLEGEGYQVISADCAETALTLLTKQSVDVVLSDLRMPGLDGMSLFDEIAKRYQGLPVVLMTAHGSIPEAVAATQRGVFGFLTKPLNNIELRDILTQAVHQSVPEQADWREEIVSRSPLMAALLEQAYRVAQRDVSVLITGASGTGKELLAKAIHKASPRNGKNFVAINCGALPEHLLESELFGHSKGAFTGAVSEHGGLFREADGGTLFLDEIGDMPVALQVKLLRALQERQIRPVGSSKTIAINVRLLSATHRDLQQAMADGSFREDLYYRLNVVNLHLPGLEQRPEDIPLLARHVLALSAERHNVKVTRFADDALQTLATAKWPGNVRQLVNVVEQCVALTQSPVIGRSLVEQALSQNTRYWPTLTDARDQFECQYLVRVLKMTEGNVTRAAELAGRNRTDFYKLLKKHDLNAAQVASDTEELE